MKIHFTSYFAKYRNEILVGILVFIALLLRDLMSSILH
jgi:hypothetical protein